MQIKTTMNYPLTPVRMAIINKQQTSAGEDVEKGEHLSLLTGMQTGTATVENSVEVPQKVKNVTAL